MAENCEDVIPLENIDYCPNVETAPGVSEVGVYGASVYDFLTIAKPADLKTGNSLESIATIAEAHTFKEGRGFHRIYLDPDTGMVETAQAGEKGNLSFNNTFTGGLQGTGAKNAGYVRKYKNTPMIFVVKEKDGNIKQIGTELSPAYMSEVTATSGQKAGDKKGTTIKLMDTVPYPAPEYAGTIQEFPAPAPEPAP